jgi:isopenicillin-N epimerase
MELGAAIRHEWTLDPEFLTVNHGSFGATPKLVLAAQSEWRRRMEAQPTRFMTRELGPALHDAAGALGQFVGAEGRDIAFVENATAGCNAVLRSLEFSPGDEILVLDHGYRAVRHAVQYVAGRSGARMTRVELPFPRPTNEAIVAAVMDGVTPRTKLAVIDHITSPSALVIPIAAIVAACHAAGVSVLVDGAHGPGQVDLDLTALDADYYVGNCHKWLMAPKGCGFLHARRDRQDGLHPLTISHGYGGGFRAEFDWTGTTDFSAYLAVTAAIAFHERLGGAALRARNADLARRGAEVMARALGGEIGGRAENFAAMAVVRLPGLAGAAADDFRARLLGLGTDAPVHAIGGDAWLRLSAAAYNALADFEALTRFVQSAAIPTAL